MPEEYTGAVIDMLNHRKGQMVDMGTPSAAGMQPLLYEVPPVAYH